MSDDTSFTAGEQPTSPDFRPTPTPSVPAKLGRYTLVDRLGEGAMGTVYLAVDSVLEMHVALKVPLPHLLGNTAARKRFLREGRAAASLHHTNLAHVFDVGEAEGWHYIVLHYVPGKRLRVEDFRAVPRAAACVRTLALAMAAAHRLRVIHRDLKPSNILVTPEGEPVITDFGLALFLDDKDRITEVGVALGTLPYMAPEQLAGETEAHGPGCDIYSLGVILYEMLTGKLPFTANNLFGMLLKVKSEAPVPPINLRPDLPKSLSAVCLRALEKRAEDRFASMKEFAAALNPFVETLAGDVTLVPPTAGDALTRPAVAPSCVRTLFVGHGERATGPRAPADRLYLDVGNDLTAGVIDQHQRVAYQGSTASLVLAHPNLIDGAVRRERSPADTFTLVMHAWPDLDCVASAYLATAYLEHGRFPDGAERLARYLDRIDQGELGLSMDNPFSLYAAYMTRAERLSRREWGSEQLQWQAQVKEGLRLVEFSLAESARLDRPLDRVDAFACDLLTDADRDDVLADVDRYHNKLSDPRCKARRATLSLPGEFGGRAEVPALRVRHVQDIDDPQRCRFFKDWARTDEKRAGNDRGFVALSVFMKDGGKQRCILSVIPGCHVTLRGLGALLDEAEAARRKEIYGVDDRVTDPESGKNLAPRSGFGNADPWYDGRSEGWTIVDAPRSGTRLTADEIEGIFLKFGLAEPASVPSA